MRFGRVHILTFEIVFVQGAFLQIFQCISYLAIETFQGFFLSFLFDLFVHQKPSGKALFLREKVS